jgi:steroid 5-alpha reductase family enzyme
MERIESRCTRSTVEPVGKAASLARISVVYVVAFAVGFAWLMWGPHTGRLWLDSLIADVLATLVVFAASRFYRNSSCYDAYWSVLPPLLTLYWWIHSSPDTNQVRSALVTTLIFVWAIRLTGNWLYAFAGLKNEDWRYPLLRNRAGRAEFVVDLVAIHLVPTGQVFLGLLPVYVAVTSSARDFGWIDVVAFVVGIAAVTLELVADTQMHRFTRQRQPGRVMASGLWSWSRHPNYFGEVSFWFALGLFGIAASPADAWWLLVGTVAMLAMFLGASIPMMEKRSVERRPDYQAVIDRVPRFVPRPPRRAQV